MKKNVLIVLIVLSSLDLLAQIGKGKIMVSVDGDYIKTSTENGVTTNQNLAQIKNLSVGTSVGYFITDRFIAGVGLDYYWDKESRSTEMMMNKFVHVEVMDVKSYVFLPNIYFGYYYPINNKLYINANLEFSYSTIKSDYNSLIVGRVTHATDTVVSLSDSLSPTYHKSYGGNSEVDFFSVRLFPELTYFITSNFGLCLGLGGIEYSMADWKTDNSSWGINFNPVNWRFGIKIKI